MKKIITICLGILCTLSLSAHDPLSAKFELKETQNGAIIDIYLTQTGVHRALEKSYPHIDFDTFEAKEYKKLLVGYLKTKIHIEADGELLQIGAGAIKLGSHQTDLKFQIDNYPKQVKALKVNIDAFKENGRQQSVFWWYTSEIAERVILSSKNEFRAEINLLGNNKPEGFLAGIGSDLLWFVLAITCFAFVGQLVKKQRQQTNHQSE